VGNGRQRWTLKENGGFAVLGEMPCGKVSFERRERPLLQIINITCIIKIMKSVGMAGHKSLESKSATILDASAVYSREWKEAIKKVAAGLSKPNPSREESRPHGAFAVLVGKAKGKQTAPIYLPAAKAFAKAYIRGLQAISRIKGEILKFPQERLLTALEPEDHIRIFIGRTTEEEVQKQIRPDPGIFILGSHLDETFLTSLELPPPPELLLEVPMVIQVEAPVFTLEEIEGVLNDSRVETRRKSIVVPAMPGEDRDSLEWRKQFIEEYPSWTSAEIARQSTSLARNQAAIASRWAKEKKVFAIDYQGQKWFPKFQFQHGRPIPAVSRVLEMFPEHATGWDLAYFFTTPNANIANRRPYELLKEGPSRVVSLAQAFVHPADVF
jgi:hypothetical protein